VGGGKAGGGVVGGVFRKTSCRDYWISPSSHANNFSIRFELVAPFRDLYKT
jgi:hypothetical protein